jgi:hypothetical protein
LAEKDEDWYVSPSCVEGGDESVFDYREAIFVPHSIDGGLSDWLPAPTRKWDTYIGVGQPLSDDSWKQAQDSDTKENLLPVHCHCRGVSFDISRPAYHSEAFRKDFPDLTLPSEDPTKRNADEDRQNGTWWISSDRSKYIANTCLCTSDRLSTGCEMMQWSFVPTAFITLPNGSHFKNIFGTLKEYESSPKTFRR